ncbi:hypothetical protein PTSG_02277 [Salpingoeca rosetta]|uniref:RNA polymerase-associated protein LEO1 n=1 Tax=Salpingoeca rosetta (strain ATCC 50818 / BSB-021) TaxID=946362 RepID=F2U1R0_SALR5|nr:uncharacterized protein PTSG_02277 [Salpingoeca rosetta]EGD81562.1 hypothetical protein PTSG_02277 [Salpingoeca rosetta]|eukprot:XP_004996766.1 hypothetical protein PTSG_02277 [Salpingoeca rosetta]
MMSEDEGRTTGMSEEGKERAEASGAQEAAEASRAQEAADSAASAATTADNDKNNSGDQASTTEADTENSEHDAGATTDTATAPESSSKQSAETLEALFNDDDDGDDDDDDVAMKKPSTKAVGPLESDEEEDDEQAQAEATQEPSNKDQDRPVSPTPALSPSPVAESAPAASARDLIGDVSEDDDDDTNAFGMGGSQTMMMTGEDEAPVLKPRDPVYAPCFLKHIGSKIYLAKMPNFISINPKPFDAETFTAEENEESHVMDDLGRRRVKLRLENTIRWRRNDDGAMESNARLVRWNDNSMSLILGDEVHDVVLTDLGAGGPVQQLLQTREDGSGYEARAPFEQRLTFKAATLSGRTQQRLMHSVKTHSRAVRRTKTTVVSENPEKAKQKAIKEEQEAIRQRNRELRRRKKAKTSLTVKDLEGEYGWSINAVKAGDYDNDEDDYEDEEEDDDDFLADEEEVERVERRAAPRAAPKANKRIVLSDDEDDDDE